MDMTKLTKKQRQEIAASMISPVRCGGCDYDELGRRRFILGGKFIYEDSEEYVNILKKHNYSLFIPLDRLFIAT